MKCPVCGYPNPENSSTCFSCDAKIERSSPELKPRGGQVVGVKNKGATWKSIFSERWGILLISSILAIVSAFLPWAGAFYRESVTNSPVMTVSANLIDLVLANDVMIASLAVVFILGIVVAAFFPLFVIVPAGCLVLMAIYMPSYLLSQLPAPTPGYYTNAGLGFGYLIAWICVLSIATFLLRNWRIKFAKHRSENYAPSEQTYWEYGGRQ